MFRRVLVGFDGSPSAEDALALARRLRDPDHGALTLARVVPTRHWPLAQHAAADERVLETTALVLAGARARLPTELPVRLRAPQASSPARGLTELAESERSDVVVVGSSGRAVAGRLTLGGTANRLLQGAPCAVAVAPAGVRATESFRHVGVAYDGSPEAESALAAGYAIAVAAGAAVTLFHVLLGGPALDGDLARGHLRARLDAQERLDAAADGAPPGVNPRTVLLHDGVPGAAIGEACDGIVDLMVTGSRSYGPVQRALLGSVAHDLMEGAVHPVLVVPRVAAAVV